MKQSRGLWEAPPTDNERAPESEHQNYFLNLSFCSFLVPSHFTVSVNLQNMQLDTAATAGSVLTQTPCTCIWHGLCRFFVLW